ncbi:MAG TPA: AbgT family transporter, partial [Planctomycetota bacterium]|nr:AbgT family transporter [Planctomycetota bacterium]
TNLLTLEGFHRILRGLVRNFTEFAPLGTVLVALLGVGVAEGSGLIAAAMRLLVNAAPRALLTPTVIFAGVMSNMASELGYVLLVPLAATIYLAAGRHPIVGMAAAFAGVSGGYSANLLLGTVDPLLAGFTQAAAQLVDKAAQVNPACNYWFMAASTPLLTLVGTWVTEKIVAPRFETRRPDGTTGAVVAETASDETTARPLTALEKRGLAAAGVVALLFVGFLLLGTIPATGYLRGAGGDLLKSPLMDGIVALIFGSALLCGVAYGVAAKTIGADRDVIRGMSKSMETLAGYLVLVFFAAQFTRFFEWSGLGLIIGVKCAGALREASFEGPVLLIAFILVTAIFNLFMGSASAKWALMAPVFVPMFLLLGYRPEVVQCAYRIGDSCTNVISPMMSYFALIIAFLQRYDRTAGIGTLVSTMLPYSVAFLITWSAFFVGWIALGLPLGFG